MTKAVFIKELNTNFEHNGKLFTVEFMHLVTRLNVRLCEQLVNSLWGCSDTQTFGINMYNLFETSANSDNNVQFTPITKNQNCTVYIIYPDEHAAAFALYKIKQFKL